MKIAVLANELSQAERIEEHFRKWKQRGVPLETDCFLDEGLFTSAVETRYFDLLIIYLDDTWSGKKEMMQLLKRRREESLIVFLYGEKRLPHSIFQVKYEAQFNGHICVLDAEDIFYLESYDRKTSVVTKDKRIRIKGRLDIEEQKFSGYQFIRISRWNIINMRYIRNVEDDAVHMRNGDILYINGRRRKVFMERYKQYLRENSLLV